MGSLLSPKDEREKEGYERKVFDLALIRLRSDVSCLPVGHYAGESH